MENPETDFPDSLILIEVKEVVPLRVCLMLKIVITFVMTIAVKLRVRKGR